MVALLYTYPDSIPIGGTGNDLLDGGTGSDRLNGGTGNDIYVVNTTSDIITEAANFGTDTVRSSVTYTLGSNLENLTLTGTRAINRTGNGLNNFLFANAANNNLNGGAGNDTLDGDFGNDNLIGGDGNDSGSGGDVFFLGDSLGGVAYEGESYAIITDFYYGEGDKFQVSGTTGYSLKCSATIKSNTASERTAERAWCSCKADLLPLKWVVGLLKVSVYGL